MRITNLIFSNDESTVVRILVLIGISWVPLVVLTLIDGTFIATDITMPFIKDVVPQVRSLVAIPLLVMADNIIEPMMSRVMGYLKSSGVVPESEQSQLHSAAEKMACLMNNKWIQALIVLLAVAVSWLLQTDYLDMWKHRDVTSWAMRLENDEVDETFACLWFLLVSSPMVSFLLYRWIWRYLVWSLFLYRVSRLKLALYASHSDLAGGLGFVGASHATFSIVFVILAALLSSDLASNLLFEGDKLVDMKLVVLVYITISVVIIVSPLLFFATTLFTLKRKSLAEYGELQHQASGDFHQFWITKQGKELVDSIQPSAMADYSAVYEVIRNMRVIPLSTKGILTLAIILLVPFLPLTLTESSIQQVLGMIRDSLI
jgi:hypothetical protein